MISRANKKLVDQFLMELTNSHTARSIESIRSHLTILLTYYGDASFQRVLEIGHDYKNYLQSDNARRNGKEGPLSPSYIHKNLSWTRQFLLWLKEERGYSQIKNSWLDRHFKFTMRENNLLKNAPTFLDDKKGEFWFSPEEIVIIARTPVKNLLEERTRAACIFLYLSAMRIDAFMTLPIHAVDIDNLQLKQWPELGVKTKLHKKATTCVSDIAIYPELLQIVRSWDAKVRGTLPLEAMWFPNLDPFTGELDSCLEYGNNRDSGFRKDLKDFLKNKAGIDYKSPHKFRHGNIRYFRDRAEGIRDLEAIAHNCMQTVPTMLRYARISEDTAQVRIQQMAKRDPQFFKEEGQLQSIDPLTIKLAVEIARQLMRESSLTEGSMK
jgi:site-specific recombinase XerD